MASTTLSNDDRVRSKSERVLMLARQALARAAHAAATRFATTNAHRETNAIRTTNLPKSLIAHPKLFTGGEESPGTLPADNGE